MKKITIFSPAFHKIDDDPKKNYGVGAVRCLMVLIGKKGATHFSFSTGMYLPRTYSYWKSRGVDLGRPNHMGYDFGYHSPYPMFEGQTQRGQKCEFLKKPCYCDGSALRGDEVMDILIDKGSDEVWMLLKEYYEEKFQSKI